MQQSHVAIHLVLLGCLTLIFWVDDSYKRQLPEVRLFSGEEQETEMMGLWTQGCPPHRAVFLLCTSPSGRLGLSHSRTMGLLSLPSNHPKSLCDSRKVQDQSLNALRYLASVNWQSFVLF